VICCADAEEMVFSWSVLVMELRYGSLYLERLAVRKWLSSRGPARVASTE